MVLSAIQIELGESMCDDISADKALELYRKYIERQKLMQIKNHDYDEAWRLMRPQSYTDLILQKYIAPSKLKIIKEKH